MREALQDLNPINLFKPSRHEAVICIGKAALSTASVVTSSFQKVPTLVIYPIDDKNIDKHGTTKSLHLSSRYWKIGAEHPIPGSGSFLAGKMLFEYFDLLRVRKIKSCEVYLSGGGSSLMWMPTPQLAHTGRWAQSDLIEVLTTLYRKPLSIKMLNKERSKLCLLKGGGAARVFKSLVPRSRLDVNVISDVAPFGPEIVASGPFFDGQTRHHTVLDNQSFVDSVAKRARRSGLEVIEARSGVIKEWSKLVNEIKILAGKNINRSESALILIGCEPKVDLSKVKRPGRGGRQSQMALGLLLALWDEVRCGRVEIGCCSSDGVDGRSGSLGSFIGKKEANRIKDRSRANQELRRFNSAKVLSSIGALIPQSPTGTNVQDLVAVYIKAKK